MRLSRVLLAGAAVAAAGIATSAFTAGNDVQDSVAGYGDSVVSGAETSNINYVLNATDKSVVDQIHFELVEDMDDAVVQGLEAWLTLSNNDVPQTAVKCEIDAFTTVTPVRCLITGTALASFDGVALTVAE